MTASKMATSVLMGNSPPGESRFLIIPAIHIEEKNRKNGSSGRIYRLLGAVTLYHESGRKKPIVRNTTRSFARLPNLQRTNIYMAVTNTKTAVNAPAIFAGREVRSSENFGTS